MNPQPITESRPINELMVKIADLANALGVERINQLLACWEYEFGPWRIALNGHREPCKDSTGFDVPPFNAYVRFNGWPAGTFDSFGGIFAAGSAATQDAFCDAVDAEIARLHQSTKE